MLTPKISSARPHVSQSVRPQRLLPPVHLSPGKSMTIWERAGVSESGTVSRFTQDGTAGPS
jgi:hypothetical protein